TTFRLPIDFYLQVAGWPERHRTGETLNRRALQAPALIRSVKITPMVSMIFSVQLKARNIETHAFEEIQVCTECTFYRACTHANALNEQEIPYIYTCCLGNFSKRISQR